MFASVKLGKVPWIACWAIILFCIAVHCQHQKLPISVCFFKGFRQDMSRGSSCSALKQGHLQLSAAFLCWRAPTCVEQEEPAAPTPSQVRPIVKVMCNQCHYHFEANFLTGNSHRGMVPLCSGWGNVCQGGGLEGWSPRCPVPAQEGWKESCFWDAGFLPWIELLWTNQPVSLAILEHHSREWPVSEWL